MKKEAAIDVKAVVDVVRKNAEQKLSLQEFTTRKSGLNSLLISALQFLHGKEKHSESEWMELYVSTSKRQTK